MMNMNNTAKPKERTVFLTYLSSGLKSVIVYTATGKDLMQINRASEMEKNAPGTAFTYHAFYLLVTVDGACVDDTVLEEMSIDDTLYLLEIISLLFTPIPQKR